MANIAQYNRRILVQRLAERLDLEVVDLTP